MWYWNVDSAIWQVTYGEDSERTDSAMQWLIASVEMSAGSSTIAIRALEAITELRRRISQNG